jgi:hypothetical protein
MDDLERDLRATFDRLADRAVPSAELVERTVERSDQIKRHRRTAIASGLAAVAVVASLTAVSIAGAGTRSSHLQVTGPTGVELPAATTTTESTTTTTTVVPPPPVTTHHYTVPPARPSQSTTTVPACNSAGLGDATTLTLLDDGDMQAVFTLPVGPAKEVHHYVLDDGTSGSDGIVQVFTPDQFGTHSYDEWSEIGGNRSCTEHHTFDVEPSAVTTTTMPGDTTTTSTSSDSTTIPTGTTVPTTSTTIGH